HWDKFTASRKFRGTQYNITVENPSHVECGVKEVYINGSRIDGNVLPVSETEVCNVKVIMG
ncbi:MAG TPA: hypothetical protein PLA88_11530, partial [Bacteroidales bacterium]|nr:hypothetical protein [Bacteroidales bacterium]